MKLSLHEARIIGVLLEKEITTPDQYPLSLNALTLGCNQKTSRDPVLSLCESDTQNAIDALNKKRLLSEQSGFGSRVIKYKHRFCNTEFSKLQLNSGQLAIVCLLLLRGPQTPGELRTRSNRLHDFHDVREVETLLSEMENSDSPLVSMLPREAGRREARYIELLSEGNEHLRSQTGPQETPLPDATLEARVAALEEEVEYLKSALNQLLTDDKA